MGEAGFATVEMTNSRGRSISPGDVMFTVLKLARMSQKDAGELTFDGDVGKIQANHETGNAVFDMGVEDAKKLIEFSADIDAGGAVFSIMKEMEIERGRNFGQSFGRGGGRGGRGGRGGYGRGRGRGGGRGGYGRGGGGSYGRGGGGSYNRNFRGNGERSGRGGYRDGGGDGGGYGGRGGGGGSYGNRYDGGRGGGYRSQSNSANRQRSNEW
mmetsp:Transcript_6747/g.14739  ORF Transcript_6747/g.14739 Transcript_6747/m.14739 type:complete len:212 (+) Transcript_6747:2313-2948(+)